MSFIIWFMLVASIAAQSPQQSRTPNNYFPRWSSDGKTIVFTSDRDGDGPSTIYTMTPMAQTCRV